ncbi:MAG TPA: hypothetical protein VIK86_01175 [Candidatus Paceibacterota bacterium]
MENNQNISIKNLSFLDWIILICSIILLVLGLYVTIETNTPIIFGFFLSFIPIYIIYTKIIKITGGKLTKRYKTILILMSIFIFIFSFIQFYLTNN